MSNEINVVGADLPYKQPLNLHIHSGDLGDIIYYLPFIKRVGGVLRLVSAFEGQRVLMTTTRCEFIYPLLRNQHYIDAIDHPTLSLPPWYCDDKITRTYTSLEVREYIISCHRSKKENNLLTAAFVINGLTIPDVNEPWLTPVPISPRPLIEGPYVVMARSGRYHSLDFPWHEIFDLMPRIVFVGTGEEFYDFSQDIISKHANGNKIFHYDTANAVLLEHLLVHAKAVFCNQSLPYAICEGHKLKNVCLEVAPNPIDYHVIFKRPGMFHHTNPAETIQWARDMVLPLTRPYHACSFETDFN